MKYLTSCFLISTIILLAFIKPSSFNITGFIKDADGKPISTATVTVRGTNISAQSDLNGAFSIAVPDNKKVLVFSSMGFETQEIKLGSVRRIDVTLITRQSQLEEVTITGYGGTSQTKNYVPSIALKSIQGAVSGVNISRDGDYRNYADKYVSFDSSEGWRTNNNFNSEGYDQIIENPFLGVNDNPLSTFSIDVDGASYSNMRRFINDGELPPAGAIRIEEMINYFSYDYPQPRTDEPFSINTEISTCPWNQDHKLVLVGLQGRKIPIENLPASNLVFLVDVSGSMDEPNKLPLVKTALKLLVDQLREQDNVALVVYAGNAGLVLPSTSGANKIKIKTAIDALDAGGSTAGGQGIQLAYKVAKENFSKQGNNRVIICTDGDFNVGLSSDDALESLIEKERSSGIFLTVLGFGTGNYQDAKMQKLADKGNGNHAYIDGINEAKKVLIQEFGGTIFTIAKDVKLQIEFNPAKVLGYRLIGYENRMLAKEDFNNDAKDAGELGSGHTVTALYEIIPAGLPDPGLGTVDPLRYQKAAPVKLYTANADEIMNVKLRYKKPKEEISRLLVNPLLDNQIELKNTSDNFRFATAVASFGMVLRNSPYKGTGSFEAVEQLAKKSLGNDVEGYRKEFIELIRKASLLAQAKEVLLID